MGQEDFLEEAGPDQALYSLDGVWSSGCGSQNVMGLKMGVGVGGVEREGRRWGRGVGLGGYGQVLLVLGRPLCLEPTFPPVPPFLPSKLRRSTEHPL